MTRSGTGVQEEVNLDETQHTGCIALDGVHARELKRGGRSVERGSARSSWRNSFREGRMELEPPDYEPAPSRAC